MTPRGVAAARGRGAAALGDYRVVTWRDTCPDEYVESFGHALSRAMSLIPQGDLDLEDRDWTVERVREPSGAASRSGSPRSSRRRWLLTARSSA